MSDSKMISKAEVLALLTQDSYHRRIKNWPLLTSKDIFKPIQKPIKKNNISDDILVIKNVGSRKRVININKIKNDIDDYFPFTSNLLSKFKGNIVACGGVITKTILRFSGEGDIDFFFYNLDVETANSIRIEALIFLINSWKSVDDMVNFDVHRNGYVTTLYVTDNEDIQYKYQFIHRIYPNISTILGGFDLSCCMIAYDGEEIYTTPLGCWSLRHHAIIVDLKRRSTSFEVRLIKYFNRGLILLLPGLNKYIINKYIFDPLNDRVTNFKNDIFDLVRKYDYLDKSYIYDHSEIERIEDFCSTLDIQRSHNIMINNIQKDENILPQFRIKRDNTRLVLFNKYDHSETNDQLITKISDYEHYTPTKFYPHINLSRLRLNKINSIVSILHFTSSDNNIEEQILNDINNPNINFNDATIEHYKLRVEKIRDPHKIGQYDRLRLLKCFGSYVNEVIDIRNDDIKYYQYRDKVIKEITEKAKLCEKELIGIKWITNNPGRQWTSSINPIIEDPREWYGKHYVPVITGIPEDIETCLRLARLRSIWSLLPNDIFDLVLLQIMKLYADEAWQYI